MAHEEGGACAPEEGGACASNMGSTALQSLMSRHCHFLWYSHVGQEHHSKKLHCSALTNLYCVPHGRFTRDLTEFPPTTLPR